MTALIIYWLLAGIGFPVCLGLVIHLIKVNKQLVEMNDSFKDCGKE